MHSLERLGKDCLLAFLCVHIFNQNCYQFIKRVSNSRKYLYCDVWCHADTSISEDWLHFSEGLAGSEECGRRMEILKSSGTH